MGCEALSIYYLNLTYGLEHAIPGVILGWSRAFEAGQFGVVFKYHMVGGYCQPMSTITSGSRTIVATCCSVMGASNWEETCSSHNEIWRLGRS